MDKSIIIIGGGLTGLAAGCYGRMNGYRPLNEFEESLLNQENNNVPRQTLLTLSVQS